MLRFATLLICAVGVLFTPVATANVPIVESEGRFNQVFGGHVSPYDSVSRIFQDADGKLWLGLGNKGVVQYNGTLFSSVLTAKGASELTYATITGIHQDAHGDVWIATRTGLVRYTPGTGEERHYLRDRTDPKNQKNPPQNYNAAFGGERNGVLWFVGSRYIYTFTPSSGLFEVVYALPKDKSLPNFDSATLDTKGNLWIATLGNELIKLDTASRSVVKSWQFGRDLPPVGAIANLTVLPDSETHLGLLTDRGLFYLDLNDFSVQQYSTAITEPLRLYAKAPSGDLLVAGKKIYRLFADKRPVEVFSVGDPKDPLTALLADREGSIWASYDDGGLWKHSNSADYANLYQPLAHAGRAKERIYATLHAGDFYWLGTEGGLFRTHALTEPAQHELSVGSEPVYTLAADREAGFWVGQRTRISRYLDGKLVEHYDVPKEYQGSFSHISSIATDSKGDLWFTIGIQGVMYVDRKTQKLTVNPEFIHENLRLTGMPLVASNRDGSELYFTAYGYGFYVYNVDSGKTEEYLRGHPFIPTPDLSGIDVVGDDVYLFSDLRKVTRYHIPTRNFSELDPPVSGITCIRSNGTQFFIVQNHGAAYLWTPEQQQLIQIGTTGRPDLETTIGNGCEVDDKGVFSTPTYGGLLWVDPQRRQRNPWIPHARIDGVYVKGEWVPPARWGEGTGLHLPPTSNHLEFDIGSDSYAQVSRNKYQYRLSGIHDWLDAKPSSERISYHLPPGEYTFEARTSNDDHVWSQEPARVKITIDAPWLERSGTKAGLAGLALAALGFVAFAQYRSRVAKQIEVFAKQFSHEIRTSLSTIDYSAGNVGHLLATDPKVSVSSPVLKRITEQADILMWCSRQLRGICDMVLADADDYMTAIEDSRALREKGDFSVKAALDGFRSINHRHLTQVASEIVVDTPDDLDTVNTYPKALDVVLGNLFKNALKYATRAEQPLKLAIALQVVARPTTFSVGIARLVLEDNGAGLPPERLNAFNRGDFSSARTSAKGTGRGLRLCWRVCKQIGALVRFSPSTMGGLRCELEFPIFPGLNELQQSHNTLSAGRKILIIEDEPFVQMTLPGYMNRHGFSYHMASNPGDAFTFLEKHSSQVGLVITDYHLGTDVPNGLIVTQQLRQRYPTLPVVLMTADDDLDVAGTPLDAVIQKPLEDEHASGVLARLLTTSTVG